MNKKNLIKSFLITFLGTLAVVFLTLSLMLLPEAITPFFVLFVSFIMAWFLIYEYLK